MRAQLLIFVFVFLIRANCFSQSAALVFQSDFGLKDGAVAAMKGVAISISPDLRIFDITHEIPAYNIWEGAYRLNQTAVYWPKGTVFVSVVDPGVGSDRRSIVMKSKTGHYFVTPDNGTLTLVAESLGIDEVRQIDETRNRLKDSDESYTFHGRDVYAYTAARLASGVISFEEVGTVIIRDIVKLNYQKPVLNSGIVKGNIDILDIQYGNIWTNIDQKLVEKLEVNAGDQLMVKIWEGSAIKFQGDVKFGRTFADVSVGEPVAYMNSLMNFAIGINQGSFAGKFGIVSGPSSVIEISKTVGKQ
jgi:S-adenosylmethionine hydrolase